jgi:hypothetical protein
MTKNPVRMHYERAPVLQKEGWWPAKPAGALPPHPQDLALWCLSRCWAFASRQLKGGCRSIPPGSVEATESALGLLPSMALSSAQSGLILLRQDKRRIFARGSERMTLDLRGKCSG